MIIDTTEVNFDQQQVTGYNGKEYWAFAAKSVGKSDNVSTAFDNVSWITSYDYRRGNTIITRDNYYMLRDAQQTFNLAEAAIIDKNDHELVVDCLDLLVNNRYLDSSVFKLFSVNIQTHITEVDLRVDEFAEIRRYKALKKLSTEEIKLLDLEKQFVYLELKYKNTGANSSNSDDDIMF